MGDLSFEFFFCVIPLGGGIGWKFFLRHIVNLKQLETGNIPRGRGAAAKEIIGPPYKNLACNGIFFSLSGMRGGPFRSGVLGDVLAAWSTVWECCGFWGIANLRCCLSIARILRIDNFWHVGRAGRAGLGTRLISRWGCIGRGGRGGPGPGEAGWPSRLPRAGGGGVQFAGGGDGA